jgi:hypothetical protein
MGASGIGLVRGYYATGYGYSSYQGTPNYGVSLTKPHWWVDRILDRNDIRLVAFSERAWDYHHDIVAIQKTRIEEAVRVTSSPASCSLLDCSNSGHHHDQRCLGRLGGHF